MAETCSTVRGSATHAAGPWSAAVPSKPYTARGSGVSRTRSSPRKARGAVAREDIGDSLLRAQSLDNSLAMRFSIVTPSFRQLAWLKRAVRSVADQQGVEVEHIIQDAGTGPELEEWVRTHSSARLFVEKDNGM